MFELEYTVKDNLKNPLAKKVDLSLDESGEATLESFIDQIRLAQILIAKEVLKDEQSRGFDEKPKRLVDGVVGRREERVKPFGRIEYFSKLADLEILLEVYRAIQKRSPVRTGLYKNSNYVFVNNRLVADSEREFFEFINNTKKFGIDEIRTIRFVNVTPYAARLEYSGTRRATRGLSKGRNQTKGKRGKSRSGNIVKKPNGAYYLASRTVSGIKGFFSKVKYEFIPNGYQGINIDADGLMRKSYIDSPKNRAKRRVGKPYVYPSLVFVLDR